MSAELRLLPVLILSEYDKRFSSSFSSFIKWKHGQMASQVSAGSSLSKSSFLEMLQAWPRQFWGKSYQGRRSSCNFGLFGPNIWWKMMGVFCGPCFLAPSCGSGMLFVTTVWCGGEQRTCLLGRPEVRTSPSLFAHHTYTLSSGTRKPNPAYFCQNSFQKSKSKLNVLQNTGFWRLVSYLSLHDIIDGFAHLELL